MSQSVYYNDSEPFVCDWLENLIREKLLPQGVVDRRPIQEVEPQDVRDFAQCHFFAGIGGWAYALQLAGWGDRPVWTGSCPCQPFSAAGQRKSHADDRHLWPAWCRLIRECHPDTIFGEQVSGAAGLGWLDAVALDLEAADYAVGACVLGAHSLGAPHFRQRLYFVADSQDADWGRPGISGNGRRWAPEVGGPGAASVVADTESHRWSRQGERSRPQDSDGVGHLRSAWEAADSILCRDGQTRAIESGTLPLAYGIPGRLGRLRAYGNAIVPQVAAAFIEAYLACSLPAPEDRPQ